MAVSRERGRSAELRRLRAQADITDLDRARAQEAASDRARARTNADVDLTARTVTAPVRAAKAGVSRRGYIAALTVTALVIAVQTFRSKTLSKGERRSAVVSMAILFVAIAAVGEFSPEIATGFSVLLLVSVLIGGTNAAHYLFVQLPDSLTGKKVTP